MYLMISFLQAWNVGVCEDIEAIWIIIFIFFINGVSKAMYMSASEPKLWDCFLVGMVWSLPRGTLHVDMGK